MSIVRHVQLVPDIIPHLIYQQSCITKAEKKEKEQEEAYYIRNEGMNICDHISP
jgi:hypothetical protein